MNWVDLSIIIFLGLYALDGFRRGLVAQVVSLIVFIVSLLAAFKLYLSIGPFISERFGTSPNISNALSFVGIWIVLNGILGFISGFIVRFIPTFVLGSLINRGLGVLAGAFRGLVTVGLYLLLIVSLPVPVSLKDDLNESRLAPPIVARSQIYAGYLSRYFNQVFGGAINDTLSLLVAPEEGSTKLPFKVKNGTVDEKSEQEMFALVNAERIKRGLFPLSSDSKLQEVARAHARDMFEQGYFSHDSPDGKTPKDRLDAAGIKYTIAGENLALAPHVAMAHQGLMDSEGHRENILYPSFRKVGIGVISGGVFGKMFVQEFTD
jgi:uncharacterized protein YkwD